MSTIAQTATHTYRISHELDGAPQTASFVTGEMPHTGGGRFVLSDLKTFLEAGKSLNG